MIGGLGDGFRPLAEPLNQINKVQKDPDTVASFRINYTMDVRDGGSVFPCLCNGKVEHNVLFLSFLFYIGV